MCGFTPATNGSTHTAVEYAYTALGNIRKITTPGPNNGAAITVTYEYLNDGAFSQAPLTRTEEVLGEPLRITYPRNNSFATASTHLRYDARGNVVQAWDELNNPTDFEYHDTNSLKKVKFPPTTADPSKRASIVYTYQHPDGSGSVASAAVYSETGALVRQVTRKSGNEDEFKYVDGPVVRAFPQYDSLYRTTGVQNDRTINGMPVQAKQFAYDEASNFKGVTYANGNTTLLTKIDPDSNILQRTDGLGRATDYDLAPEDSSLRRILYPDSTHNVVLDYDNFGRVSSVTDRTGLRTYEYDHLDNLVRTTILYFAPNGTPLPTQVVEYLYHTDGTRQWMFLTTQDTLGSAPIVWQTKYQYNPDGTLQRVEFPWEYFQIANGVNSSGDVNFTYDAKGRLVHYRQTRVRADYAYDARDFLVGLRNYNPNPVPNGTNLSLFGSTTNPAQYISYDAQGLPLSVPYTVKVSNTNDSSGTITYGYDPKFRLSNEHRTLSAAVGGLLYNLTFTLDAADNLTSARGYSLPADAADQIDLAAFDYNANGNLFQSQGHDENGVAYNYSLTYDFENTPTNVGGIQQAFTIEGQRAWKQFGADPRTYFLYDGDDLIAELDSQMRLRAFYGFADTGLLTRFQQTYPNNVTGGMAPLSGRTFRQFTYDPNGHLIHRVLDDDYNLALGNSWFASDTVLYDTYGGLWADWGFRQGGAPNWFPTPDSVGAFGQFGHYTDIESRPTPKTTPLVLAGRGYLDPQAGKLQSRSGGLNEYEAAQLPYQVMSGIAKGIGNAWWNSYVGSAPEELLATNGVDASSAEAQAVLSRARHPFGYGESPAEKGGHIFGEASYQIGAAYAGVRSGGYRSSGEASGQLKLDFGDVPPPTSPASNQKYLTYVFVTKEGKVVYVGKTSGEGSIKQVMNERYSGKPTEKFRPDEGDTMWVIDTQSSADANKGAEQVWYDYYKNRGAQLRNNYSPLDMKKGGKVGRATRRKIEAYLDELRSRGYADPRPLE